MVTLLDEWSCRRSRSNEWGGSCTRVDRPDIKDSGTPEGVPRTATAKRRFRQKPEKRWGTGAPWWVRTVKSDRWFVSDPPTI